MRVSAISLTGNAVARMNLQLAPNSKPAVSGNEETPF